MASRYHEVYDSWKRDPEAFWAEAAQAIDWFRPASRIFDPAAGVYGAWFPDAAVQHLLQRRRPACRQRTRRSDRR